MAKLTMTMAKLAMGGRVGDSVSVIAFVDVSGALSEIGGERPWKDRLDRIAGLLPWGDGETARNRIRHLIKSEQTPTPGQTFEIMMAHALHAALELKAQRDREASLKATIQRFVDLAQRVDAASLGASVDAYSQALDRLRELDLEAPDRPGGAAGAQGPA